MRDKDCKICNHFQLTKTVSDISIGLCQKDKNFTMSESFCKNFNELNYLKYLFFYFKLVLEKKGKGEIIKLLKEKGCHFTDLIIGVKIPTRKQYDLMLERKKFLEKK